MGVAGRFYLYGSLSVYLPAVATYIFTSPNTTLKEHVFSLFFALPAFVAVHFMFMWLLVEFAIDPFRRRFLNKAPYEPA